MNLQRGHASHDEPSSRGASVMVCLLRSVLWSVVATLMIFIMSGILATFNVSWDAPDEFTYDWRTALLSDIPPDQRSDIALVLIDDNSIAEYLNRSPVDRGLIAELVKSVGAAQPKAIGLDFIFDRRSEPTRNEALVQAIKTSKVPIILGVTTDREGPISPENLELQDRFVSSTGNPEPRPAGTLFFGEQGGITLGDNVIRTMGGPLSDNAYKYNRTFDLLLAEIDGPKTMPTNRLIAWLLRPKGNKRDTFATVYIPRHDPVDGLGDGHTVLPENLRASLKGKIVIIGGDFIDRDQHRIPLSVETKAPVPGSLIHAQIVAQLIDGRAIREVPNDYEIELIFLICLAGFLISSRYVLFGIELFSHLVFLITIVCIGGFVFWKWKTVLPSSTMFSGWLSGAIGGRHYEKVVQKIRAWL
jgi:adenylate cyclase